MNRASAPLSALIVDDEAPARTRLRKLLEPMVSSERIRLVGEASDGVEALDIFKESKVDVAFLDIQMPEMNGFEVLEKVDASHRPVVIFTTAYDNYALRAFEASAVDYLLKPISKERLEDAVERARRIVSGGDDRALNDERLATLLEWIGSEKPVGPQKEHVRQLSVPYRDRILLIPVEDVISAEINEGITRVFVVGDDPKAPRSRLRQHVVNYTLDQLETMLPTERFMRVHRSAIVQLDAIAELVPWFSGRYKLILTGDHEVIASRERSKVLKDSLMI